MALRDSKAGKERKEKNSGRKSKGPRLRMREATERKVLNSVKGYRPVEILN